MLKQVTFRFPNDSEIRYLEREPSRGDRVRGRRGESYVVVDVEREADACVARCATPVEYASDVRGLSQRMRTAVGEMRERTRELLRRTRESQAHLQAKSDDLSRPHRQG